MPPFPFLPFTSIHFTVHTVARRSGVQFRSNKPPHSLTHSRTSFLWSDDAVGLFYAGRNVGAVVVVVMPHY